jgi:hypothetical protein
VVLQLLSRFGLLGFLATVIMMIMSGLGLIFKNMKNEDVREGWREIGGAWEGRNGD